MKKHLLTALLMLMSLPAFGQEIRVPAAEISAGYTFLNDDDLTDHGHGWAGSLGFNVDRWTGIIGEFGGNYSKSSTGISGSNVDVRLHSFMGGLQVNIRNSSPVVPFAQLVVGGVRRNITAFGKTNTTDVAMQLGGGADFWIRPTFGVRVSSVYRHIFMDERTNNNPTDGFRFQAGVVLALGNK